MTKKKRTSSKPVPAQPASTASQRVPADRLLVAIALAGVLVTAVLLWGAHASGGLPYCAAGSGCDVVQASPWSRFSGVPLAFWGLLAYGLLAILAASGTRARRRRTVAVLATAGFGISVYLTGVSLLIIGATCPYCLVSAALFTAAFALSLRAATRDSLGAHGLGAAVAVLVAVAMQMQAGGLFTPAAAVDPYLKGLASHLEATGAKFYGASWCPHCQQQKALFGAASSALPYVECSPNGPKAPRATNCEMAGIHNYPTWIIDSRRLERVLQAKELAVLTGYPLPPETPDRQP